MAGTGLLALLDDITTLLDDVAAMTKVAARKTAGVLGDDLALNAQQVSGVRADRELPVVLAVARGSLVNKAILVPAALLISVTAPWAVVPLLMLGGAYLCFEGAEKVLHKLLHPADGPGHAPAPQAAGTPEELERARIRGAVRTDFILSAEIIVISLGTVADAGFVRQLGVLVGISLVMTVGVYGLVAGIVKLDDAGLALARREGWMRTLGRGIVLGAPYLMKTLSILGTAAMFLVGGGILVHGIPALHHAVGHAHEVVAGWPGVGWLAGVVEPLANGIAGLGAGGALTGAVALGRRLRTGRAA